MVAMTGYGQEEDKKQAYDAGFDLHLTKPLSGEVLGTLLECLSARHDLAAGAALHGD
jgi:CheY-like chemotaxis protein